MALKISISIDVDDMQRAVTFYREALGCEAKTKYSDDWEVLSFDGVDLHLQNKAAGTTGAGDQSRHYGRHWTPVHLDFTVDDVRTTSTTIEQHGGQIEHQAFSERADIAHCVDPFGNGFCVIRE